MAIRDTRTIRVKTNFIEDILDKIIDEEAKKGRDDTQYPMATKILRERILRAGGLR